MNSKQIYMDKWIKIRQCTSGDKLYHYTTAQGIKSIMETNEFWASKCSFLNDKSEFQYIEEIIEKVCKQYFKSTIMYNIFIEALFEEIHSLDFNTLDKNIFSSDYVLSFSQKRDNALLWSEYSNFMGYSVQFDFEKLIANIKKSTKLFWHGEVIYSEEKQSKLLLKALNYVIGRSCKYRKTSIESLLNEDISDNDLTELIGDFAIFCSVYSMFFKKECFAEEAEYRFVFHAYHEEFNTIKKEHLTEMKFREKEQFLLPYITIKLGEDNKLPVESITVGPKNSIDLAVKGMQHFLRKMNYEIPVYSSEIPLRY